MAIVLQNQFLANVKILPVIGISPKALQQPIILGNTPSERLIGVLNRYKYFSSIEPTSQSEKLGKYIFMTTETQFEEVKKWINSAGPSPNLGGTRQQFLGGPPNQRSVSPTDNIQSKRCNHL
jgi:hypothetical protein